MSVTTLFSVALAVANLTPGAVVVRSHRSPVVTGGVHVALPTGAHSCDAPAYPGPVVYDPAPWVPDRRVDRCERLDRQERRVRRQQAELSAAERDRLIRHQARLSERERDELEHSLHHRHGRHRAAHFARADLARRQRDRLEYRLAILEQRQRERLDRHLAELWERRAYECARY